MKARDRIVSLLEHADHPIISIEIIETCGLWMGQFNRAVLELEREGVIESCWENQHADYPRMRMYKLKPRK